MQRRHFEVIARIIRAMPDDRARRIAAYAFADELRLTNPRFDRERFLTASGIEWVPNEAAALAALRRYVGRPS